MIKNLSEKPIAQLQMEQAENWEKEDLLGKCVSTREGKPSFIFYEGPPTANGRPGIHHVIARTLKDSVCRYKTMQGYAVKRKAGWDTHGLPVEIEVEKQLNMSGKQDIPSTPSEASIAFILAYVLCTSSTRHWADSSLCPAASIASVSRLFALR